MENLMASTGTQTNSSLLRYLEDVRDGVVEMFPLLCVEVLQLRGVLVLALVGRVRPGVELVLGLDIGSKGSVIVQETEHQTQISARTTGQDASYPLHV